MIRFSVTDGTDCSYNTSLYKDCSAMKFNILCDVLFNSSVCDQACISGECLYDGWDCEEEPPKCRYNAYFKQHYANGICDEGCNAAGCLWDSLDCVSEHSFVHGRIVIAVAVRPDKFIELRMAFLRQIGYLLHAVVVVEHDSSGREMIEMWEIPDVSLHRDRRSVADQFLDGLLRQKRAATAGYRPMMFYLVFVTRQVLAKALCI